MMNKIHCSASSAPGLLVRAHDYYHTFVRVCCSPVVALVPRKFCGLDIFTANSVTYSRTVLGILTGFLIKLDYSLLSFFMIIFHDFLDHLDGVVAHVQKLNGAGAGDDPVYGAFIDAQCDKIVFIFLAWSNLMCLELKPLSIIVLLLVIVIEGCIFTIRIQNYFLKKYGSKSLQSKSLKSVSEGKLKQKCETLGLAFYVIRFELIGLLFLSAGVYYGFYSLRHKLTKK